MTPHDPAEVRTWLHGLGLEEAPERAMAPSGGAQLLQAGVGYHMKLAAFLALSRWLGKNLWENHPVFVLGLIYHKDRVMTFLDFFGGNG